MTSFLDAWDAQKTRPTTHTGPVTAGPVSNAYARAALEGEIANLQAVPIGSGRNDQLNRSAVKMYGYAMAGAISEIDVTEALGAADGGLDYPATSRTLRSARDAVYGRLGPKQLPATYQESASSLFAQASHDPFGAGYSAPGTAHAPTTPPPHADSANTAPSSTQQPARSDTADSAENGSDPAALLRERLPILDWPQLWDQPADIEFILEPILPARRLVALYSPPKVGKSLLMLEIAYQLAIGGTALGANIERPYRVLYVDFENDPQGDIIPRLQRMGANKNELGNLCYLSFPSIAGFDSEQGSIELLAAISVYECEVVVIDTVSRSVDGDENENDTWLKFYRHTGLKLKQAGVALLRLDHTGKDETKGQRGGSAKSGDVDAVWRMQRLTEPDENGTPETFRLICEANRFPVLAADKIITLERVETPHLHHRAMASGARGRLKTQIHDYLEHNAIPLEDGYRKHLPAIKQAIPGASQHLVRDAIAERRIARGYGEEDTE